jgi:hypothetical protein
MIKTFVNSYKKQTDELETMRYEMEEGFSLCVTFFNEDPKTATPETFFSIFTTFLKNFEAADKQRLKEEEAIQKTVIKPLKTGGSTEKLYTDTKKVKTMPYFYIDTATY